MWEREETVRSVRREKLAIFFFFYAQHHNGKGKLAEHPHPPLAGWGVQAGGVAKHKEMMEDLNMETISNLFNTLYALAILAVWGLVGWALLATAWHYWMG